MLQELTGEKKIDEVKTLLIKEVDSEVAVIGKGKIALGEEIDLVVIVAIDLAVVVIEVVDLMMENVHPVENSMMMKNLMIEMKNSEAENAKEIDLVLVIGVIVLIVKEMMKKKRLVNILVVAKIKDIAVAMNEVEEAAALVREVGEVVIETTVVEKGTTEEVKGNLAVIMISMVVNVNLEIEIVVEVANTVEVEAVVIVSIVAEIKEIKAAVENVVTEDRKYH